MNSPKVAVLLAAHNGGDWIKYQIESIVRQEGVGVSVFVSDDASTDGTGCMLKEIGKQYPQVVVLPFVGAFGTAGRNFFRLISEVDVSCFDYVSFSDQDDVWMLDKIDRAVKKIVTGNFSAYSSDVVAVWANGRTRYIKKSYPQRRYDHLFESAGPGCTYVFRVLEFLELQNFVRTNFSKVCYVESYDWFIYAFYRSRKYRWVIDPVGTMYYRQHAYNSVGANASLAAGIKRLKLMICGWYAGEIYRISMLIGQQMPDARFVVRNIFEVRRRRRDRLIVFLLSFFIFDGRGRL